MSTRLATAILVAFAAMACSGPTDPSENNETTFTGTVQPQSIGEVHQFNIANTGEILITVTSVTPGNVVLGLGYGQVNGNNCGLIRQAFIGNTNIGRTSVNEQIFVRGDYCVVMFDPSGSLGTAPLTVAQNYAVKVRYP